MLTSCGAIEKPLKHYIDNSKPIKINIKTGDIPNEVNILPGISVNLKPFKKDKKLGIAIIDEILKNGIPIKKAQFSFKFTSKGWLKIVSTVKFKPMKSGCLMKSVSKDRSLSKNMKEALESFCLKEISSEDFTKIEGDVIKEQEKIAKLKSQKSIKEVESKLQLSRDKIIALSPIEYYRRKIKLTSEFTYKEKINIPLVKFNKKITHKIKSGEDPLKFNLLKNIKSFKDLKKLLASNDGNHVKNYLDPSEFNQDYLDEQESILFVTDFDEYLNQRSTRTCLEENQLCNQINRIIKPKDHWRINAYDISNKNGDDFYPGISTTSDILIASRDQEEQMSCSQRLEQLKDYQTYPAVMGYDFIDIYRSSFYKSIDAWWHPKYYIDISYYVMIEAFIRSATIFAVKNNKFTALTCNGDSNFYNNLGLISHDNRDISAILKAGAELSYKLPFTSNSFSFEKTFDLNEYMNYSGDMQFPSPGKYVSLLERFIDFDLLFNRINFAVAGVSIYPGAMLSLESKKLEFQYSNKGKEIAGTLTRETPAVPIPSQSTLSKFKQWFNLSIRPGILLNAWIDVAVWSDSWSEKIWFAPLWSSPEKSLPCLANCSIVHGKPKKSKGR